MLVRDIMNKYVLTCNRETTVHELVRLIVRNRIGAIPVVDDDNALAGIVTEGDLLYKKARPQAPNVVNILGASLYYGGYGKYEETFQKLLATQAGDIMTEDVEYVSPDTDADTVADMMVEDHLKYVPVVENGRLVGMVTRHDILAFMEKEGSAPGI
ncbi:MAG: CBS domain-containing protein [Veillonellaceae bacterium]|nr:CBS domain-containing protein [Veillonellaceae bacterium]